MNQNVRWRKKRVEKFLLRMRCSHLNYMRGSKSLKFRWKILIRSGRFANMRWPVIDVDRKHVWSSVCRFTRPIKNQKQSENCLIAPRSRNNWSFFFAAFTFFLLVSAMCVKHLVFDTKRNKNSNHFFRKSILSRWFKKKTNESGLEFWKTISRSQKQNHFSG